MEKVKIKIVNPKAVVPYKKYDGDFCYDCVAVSEEQVAPNVWKYGLGFALQRSEHTKGDTIHVSRFVPVLLCGRPVWFSVMELGQSMTSIREKYLPCSITSCQTCHATR